MEEDFILTSPLSASLHLPMEHTFFFFFFFLLLLGASPAVMAVNLEGVLLLSLKSSILADPLHALSSWSSSNPTPCSWLGVSCNGSSVTSLSLPDSQLLGALPMELGLLPNLTHLDLSNNFLNGTLPSTFANLTSLLYLSLSNNDLSGQLPPQLPLTLRHLDLSYNALSGPIPSSLPNLTVLSLSNNYISGQIPSGFSSVELLDLSVNLLSGSLPSAGIGGSRTRYLNLSSNRISGKIPVGFAAGLTTNVTIDLSSNELTGEVPNSPVFQVQSSAAFAGNGGLCGKPLSVLCIVPSSPARERSPKSPPALAVLPKTAGGLNSSHAVRREGTKGGFQPAAVVGIVVGNLAGVALVAFLVLYLYHRRKRAKKKQGSSSSSSESGETDDGEMGNRIEGERGGVLVMVDGETELEVETLLKASAYILGATGASIVYKAVLADGTALAVRRIGDGGGKIREFEMQVRCIAKLRHPNLVRVCGFYWGEEEKLLIMEYVPNGSLAHLSYKKTGSSPYHLPWEAGLLIARGVARALLYLHDKKIIHGHLKPSNILLHHDFNPILSDLGLDRLSSPSKQPHSLRQIGSSSKRSILSHSSSQQEPSPSPYNYSPYQAPESFKNLKPSTKWDVYSFGVILLEMLTGRVFGDTEIAEWGNGIGWGSEEESRAVRMANAGVRREMEGKEESIIGWFKLGLSCVAAQPGRRPTMREALQVLERLPSTSSLT